MYSTGEQNDTTFEKTIKAGSGKNGPDYSQGY